MDRERKLLYAIAVLAPVLEVMTFVTWRYKSDFPTREALIQDDRECQKRLANAWAHCAVRHLRNLPEL